MIKTQQLILRIYKCFPMKESFRFYVKDKNIGVVEQFP